MMDAKEGGGDLSQAKSLFVKSVTGPSVFPLFSYISRFSWPRSTFDSRQVSDSVYLPIMSYGALTEDICRTDSQVMVYCQWGMEIKQWHQLKTSVGGGVLHRELHCPSRTVAKHTNPTNPCKPQVFWGIGIFGFASLVSLLEELWRVFLHPFAISH